jgi:hypothetical protein
VRIPERLARLRVDRRGLPVPWLNQWGPSDGPEAASRFRIAYDRHVGRQALFLDDLPDSEPDFTKQNYARQRQAMVEGLCQVCGRPVPWSRRRLVVADMSTNVHHVTGLGLAVLIHEPWLDQRCAELATNVCPALIRRGRDEQMTMIDVTSRRAVVLTTSNGVVDGPLAAQSARIRPVMWVKVAVAVASLPRRLRSQVG